MIGLMTKLRTGEPWRTAADYGRTLTGLSLNLMVRDVAHSLPFYTVVLGMTEHYSDVDFAALELEGVFQLQLHADHTYDAMPQFADLSHDGRRGIGAEVRVMGIDPDQAEARARSVGAEVLIPAGDFKHGWRACFLRDPDGYTFAVGVAIS